MSTAVVFRVVLVGSWSLVAAVVVVTYFLAVKKKFAP